MNTLNNSGIKCHQNGYRDESSINQGLIGPKNTNVCIIGFTQNVNLLTWYPIQFHGSDIIWVDS